VAIDDFAPTASRLYVCDLVGGPSRLRLFDLRGTQLGFLPLPLNTSVRGLVPLGGDGAAFERESFVEPGAWYRFDPTTWKVTATRLRMESPADFSDVEVRREFALSKDGTRIPLNILVRKGTALDGTAPAILYGYGGYGLAERPSFDPARRLWLEQGGVYAIANVRGGGEFGQSWHHAGNMTRKQNVFDDFAACAEYLIERRYTSRSRLAAEGASNGGTLMGATLVQHPELCRAIVSQVGVYDMLRVELTPNGEFNTTEFGTVKDPDQFKALYAYSPYHNVRDGTPYPAVLLMTGDNDPRVDPMHSRKMTARLLAASASDHPILLRTSAHTGHGGGTPLSSRNAERADAYAFLVTELGVSYRPAADRSRP
jgi:prolyl oligopeptidase